MSATSVNRNTPQLAGLASLPANIAVKNDEVLPAGVMLAIDATPEIVNAADTAALQVVGRCPKYVDNSNDGEVISPEMGCFKYENDVSNPVVAGDKIAYVKDNQTVCASAGSTNKIAAGFVIAVESDGVWICQTLEGLKSVTPALAHIADVGTAGGTYAAGEVNAIGSKVNAVIAALEVAGILKAS